MREQEIAASTSIQVPREPFDEKEIAVILESVFKTIDVPRKKSEPASKTILIDFFGMPNAGKTKTTEKIEQVFRRHKFNAFCPPETAEIEEIRNKSTPSPIVFQARHLAGVQDYVLNLSNDRNFHVAIISRGLIDMLYWYEKGVRDGIYSRIHQESVEQIVYEILRMDLVDALIFFTCSVETAINREYSESITQSRGSKMNEEFLREALDIYKKVLGGVEKNVPSLPIFQIDTSSLSIKETAEEVMRFLLPTICSRFQVPTSKFLPRSLTLLEKEAKRSAYFEEQLKLVGHPRETEIKDMGWNPVKESDQEDFYLNPRPDKTDYDPFSQEIIRLRRDGEIWKFMYKGPAQDRLFSHRSPLTLVVSTEEAKEILSLYPTICTIIKRRKQFKLEPGSPVDDGHYFTLHLDTLEDAGNFTEIRARGSRERTHTKELLRLAADLGFDLKDVIEGNYLKLCLERES